MEIGKCKADISLSNNSFSFNEVKAICSFWRHLLCQHLFKYDQGVMLIVIFMTIITIYVLLFEPLAK